jgi:type IV pilus assembly protein PilA
MIRRPRAGVTEADERGFTLIELMMVVLIIAMLIAIGLPTWISARERADDAAARSVVTDGHRALQVVMADDREVREIVLTDLASAEPAINFLDGATDPEATDSEVSVYIDVPGNYAIVATRVNGAGCVAMREIQGGGTSYKRDPTASACRAASLDVPTGWFNDWPPRG